METIYHKRAKEVGPRARAIRLNKDLTQGEVAARVGLPHQEVSRFEKGVADVRASMIYKMADALGVPVEELVKEDG